MGFLASRLFLLRRDDYTTTTFFASKGLLTKEKTAQDFSLGTFFVLPKGWTYKTRRMCIECVW